MREPEREPIGHQPAETEEMNQKPRTDGAFYKPAGKLNGKVALITGADSGIGEAVAILYAKEGAKVVGVYLNEDHDAENTTRRVEELGSECLMIRGDIRDKAFCTRCVEETVSRFGKLDILINNAAKQVAAKDIRDISEEQLRSTFETNIFSMFYLTQAALEHLKEGGVVINTTSVTAYRGSAGLMDYSSTKGAIVAFTRSLALNLAEQKIRVNGVAPGPTWTPLIPTTFDKEKLEGFGEDTPFGRAGQPDEVAPAYVFLACEDSGYMTGQVLHPNGGEIINT